MIAGAWSGHIGTSFSSLDIMSWLFLNELRDLDKGPAACDIFFSSKGHDAPALYAVLIGLGLLPAEKLHELRRLHGLPGHPHVETPYVQANTGSLGMGISKAKGMALANRHAGAPRRIFVLTGDGELQEGQFWESLGSAANRGLGEIVAIIDHNKIQSDTWVEQVSHLGDLEAKLRAFGWHVARCRRSRRRRARADVPVARRDHRQAEGHRRRHDQGQGRQLHGRAVDAGRASSICSTPARRARSSTRPAWASCCATRNARLAAHRSRHRSRPRRGCATRAASRAIPTIWSPPTSARWSRRRSATPTCWRSTPT